MTLVAEDGGARLAREVDGRTWWPREGPPRTLGLALCGAVRTRARWWKMRSDRESPPSSSDRHESIVITRTPEELRIEWPWHPPRTRRIFLLVAVGLALTCAGTVAIDPGTIYAVPLGLLVLYFVVAPALNRTIVRLGHGKLRAYQRPLPFPVHGSARVAEIETLHAGTVRSSGGGGLQGDAHQTAAEFGSRVAVASARLLSGEKVRLFREFDDGWAGRYDARVRFVVDELNRELASGRWAGEARSQRRPRG